MPLPLLAGGALLLGLWGAKKGYDAYEDNSTAEYNNEKAKKIYDEAQNGLNFYCYGCHLTSKGVSIDRKMKILY